VARPPTATTAPPPTADPAQDIDSEDGGSVDTETFRDDDGAMTVSPPPSADPVQTDAADAAHDSAEEATRARARAEPSAPGGAPLVASATAGASTAGASAPDAAAPAEAPTCPITKQPFARPVATADGHIYEYAAISRWLAHHDTSPVTNAVLAHKALADVDVAAVARRAAAGSFAPSVDGDLDQARLFHWLAHLEVGGGKLVNVARCAPHLIAVGLDSIEMVREYVKRDTELVGVAPYHIRAIADAIQLIDERGA
jgi:hypothetical protein